MGVEQRAPPSPLRASSEKADGSGSILIDTTAAQLTITAPAQTPGLHCNKTLFFSFLFHLPFFFQTPPTLTLSSGSSHYHCTDAAGRGLFRRPRPAGVGATRPGDTPGSRGG